MKKKVLMISGEFPYPANHGGNVDVANRLEILMNDADVELTFLYVNKNKASEECAEILTGNGVKLIEVRRLSFFKALFFSFVFLLPLQITLRYKLRDVDLNSEFDVVFFEGEGTYLAIKNKGFSFKKSVLRVQNIEYEYFYSLSRSSNKIFKKIYYLYESFLFKRSFNDIYSSFDSYQFISSSEYVKAFDKSKSHWVPPAFDLTDDFNSKKFEDNRTILLVGSFFMPNNIEGFKWYFDYIHEIVCKEVSGVKVVLVGNGRGVIPQELIDIRNKFSNVYIEEGVSNERLKELYDSSYIFANPMQNGAGVKIKTIDALSKSFAMVSTSTGAEGTGLISEQHLFIADTPRDFALSIICLLEDHKRAIKLASEAFDFIKKNYKVDAQRLIYNEN